MQKRIEIALIFALKHILRLRFRARRRQRDDDVSSSGTRSLSYGKTVPDRVRSLEIARYVFVRAGLSAPLLLLRNERSSLTSQFHIGRGGRYSHRTQAQCHNTSPLYTHFGRNMYRYRYGRGDVSICVAACIFSYCPQLKYAKD